MHKLPRLNGCGVSSERQYCLLSADEIFLKFNEPFFGNASFNIDRLRHNSKSESRICYFFSMFPGTPDAQTAAAKWLRGIKWKAILFSIWWRNIFKYNEPFFRNASFNIDRLCHKTKSESRICYFFSMFPGTPDAQTAAAKWLRGIKWKAILFAICWRNIFQF